MAFDQYEPSFRAINAACRALLAVGTEEYGTQPQRPIFRVESYMMTIKPFQERDKPLQRLKTDLQDLAARTSDQGGHIGVDAA